MPIWKSLFGKKPAPEDWPKLFEKQTLRDLRQAHPRSLERRKVKLLCRLDVYSEDGKEKFDSGWAHITNISLSGAFLSRLRLRSEGIPTEPFEFIITVERGPTKGTVFRGTPVRFGTDKDFGLSVQFSDISVNMAD